MCNQFSGGGRHSALRLSKAYFDQRLGLHDDLDPEFVHKVLLGQDGYLERPVGYDDGQTQLLSATVTCYLILQRSTILPLAIIPPKRHFLLGVTFEPVYGKV